MMSAVYPDMYMYFIPGHIDTILSDNSLPFISGMMTSVTSR